MNETTPGNHVSVTSRCYVCSDCGARLSVGFINALMMCQILSNASPRESTEKPWCSMALTQFLSTSTYTQRKLRRCLVYKPRYSFGTALPMLFLRWRVRARDLTSQGSPRFVRLPRRGARSQHTLRKNEVNLVQLAIAYVAYRVTKLAIDFMSPIRYNVA